MKLHKPKPEVVPPKRYRYVPLKRMHLTAAGSLKTLCGIPMATATRNVAFVPSTHPPEKMTTMCAHCLRINETTRP